MAIFATQGRFHTEPYDRWCGAPIPEFVHGRRSPFSNGTICLILLPLFTFHTPESVHRQQHACEDLSPYETEDLMTVFHTSEIPSWVADICFVGAVFPQFVPCLSDLVLRRRFLHSSFTDSP